LSGFAFLLSTWWDGVVRMEAFAVGTLVAAAVTLLHVVLLSRIVRGYTSRCAGVWGTRHPILASYYYFGLTILKMVLLHVLDACVWSLILAGAGLVHEIRDAFYFSTNAYTTLGYGPMILPNDWRELAPLMAVCGLFTFGCTTSQLFAVMGYHNDSIQRGWATRKTDGQEEVESRPVNR
jgi:hypothetical protein